MHLKPINRQGKKRRKLRTLPALSCGESGFYYHIEEGIDLPKSPEAQSPSQKDQVAA